MMVKPLILSMLAALAIPAHAVEAPAVLATAGATDARLAKRGNVPSAIAALLEKANYWKSRNRKDLAVSAWKRVLLSMPAHQEALSELALYYAETGQMNIARDYLKLLAQVNPAHPVVDRVERMFSYTINQPAWQQLAQADQAFKRGDLAIAEAGYNTALTLFHDFPEAWLGLANVMMKQNKYAEATDYLDRYEAKKRQTPATARMRSEIFMKKGAAAEASRDYNEALAYYSKAKGALPNDPWATLALARMLRKQGKPDAGNRDIVQLTASSRDADTRYAGALYYSEVNQWNQVRQLLDQVAPSERTEAMRAMLARADVFVKASGAQKLYADHSEQAAIDALAAASKEAEGKADLASIVANAWMNIGKPARAVELLETVKSMTPGLQLQYAAALLQAKQDKKLSQLLEEIDRRIAAANYDREALENIRSAHSLRKADTLREAGKYEEGIATIKPLLEKQPQNVDLLLADARLLGASGAYPEALMEVDKALLVEPGNHEAIREGASYAIRMKDYPLAERYLSGIRKDDQDWAALYVEAGHLAEANDNPEKAASYFALGGQVVENEVKINTSISPNRQSSNNTERFIPYLEVAYAMRNKNGMGGLSHLYETEVPMAYHLPMDGGSSSLVFKATAVKLDAGDAAQNLDLFGTNPPAAPLPVPYPVSASGTAFSVGYQSSVLAGDIGVSPLGFKFNNVVGGVRWNKDIAGANIALEATRRSVTDSVLSYAGAIDNVTRMAWGGVTKSGAKAAIYYPFGESWSGYASVSYYGYSGSNVANNASSHINLSLIYLLGRTDDFEASLSARLTRSGFNNNQNYFTWGNGGYYSPQRDTGITVPLHLTGMRGNLIYELNLSLGFSNVLQDAALVYPTNPVLQAGLGAAGIQPASVNYGKRSMGVDWTISYEFAPQMTVGNHFHYDESTTYQQMGIMLFVRYDFDKRPDNSRVPPYPVKPYYLLSQGGAGLN